jgi:glyoxylate/hydroxypyruvate reductase
MAKTKVVVTRQLIDEAQALLDAKKDELEIVQWKSEKARHPEVNLDDIGG